MSSYLNIYVRKANTETCISLVSYSRSNRIYETFDQVFGNNIESWENPKCQSLTIGDLNEWTDYIEAEGSMMFDINVMKKIVLNTIKTYNNILKQHQHNLRKS